MTIIGFEGIRNARDLGGIPVSEDRVVKPGLFIRSANLNAPTDSDCLKLTEELNVSTVIDLRTGWEREGKPDASITSIDNLHIPFFDQEIVGIEYEKPVEGTIMIGRDFACDPADFYQSMANPLTAIFMGKAIRTVFKNAREGRTTLVHCNGGKDRAGIMSLLILEILGAEREVILEDYLLTNISRDKHIKPIFERFLKLTGDEEHARKVTDDHRAKPSNLDNFYMSVDKNFGGMDAFIRNQLGISDAYRDELRRICTQPATN